MDKLSKDIDCQTKIINRMIIICWILLFVCFFIKLFGGNFFEIICKNEQVINFCNYIDNSIFFYIISFVWYYITTLFYLLAVSSLFKFNKKQFIIISILLIFTFSVKFISLRYSFVVDICLMIITPLFINNNISLKRRFILTMFGFILFNIFNLISLFIKNLGIGIIDYGSLVSFIFSIDYGIMLILYYLYSNLIRIKKQKKENKV